MFVGVPKEIKNNENRIALVPAGAAALIKAGHRVLVEQGAGLGCGFKDGDFQAVGAAILKTAEAVWREADMIIKVKEPLPQEYQFFREGLVIFTYLHLAPEPELTKQLAEKKVVAVAYETVQLANGSLPLLTPMSEVAGRMAVQIGARFLERVHGGKGILLGGVPGVAPAKVTIIGGGVVGINAAKIAIGMGARVTILDNSLDRLRYLDDVFGGRLKTIMSNEYNIANSVQDADLLVGAVLVPGAKAPRLVSEDMVKTMEAGSVIIDVAIDQGGSIATIDRVTTHDNPVYLKHGVLHYAVANIPGAVARTSTLALTNATLPYALELASKGWLEAIRKNEPLRRGINLLQGHITYQAVAEAMNLPYLPVAEFL